MFLYITTLMLFINYNSIIKFQESGSQEEPICFIWFKDETDKKQVVAENYTCKEYFIKYGNLMLDIGQYNSDRD